MASSSSKPPSSNPESRSAPSPRPVADDGEGSADGETLFRRRAARWHSGPEGALGSASRAGSATGRGWWRALIERWAVWRGRRVEIPLRRQTTEAGCAAACLAMVASHLGRATETREAEEILGHPGRGVSGADLVDAAARLGLRGRGLRLDSPDQLVDLEPGAVLHWRFSHFVVLEAVDGVGATVVDPAVGRRRVDAAELDRCFTGVALLFEPGESFEQRRRARGPRPGLGRLLRLVVGSPVFVRLLVTSVLLQVLALAVPGLIALLVDRVVPEGLTGWLAPVALGALAVVTVHGGLAAVRGRLLVDLRAAIDRRSSLDFLEHLLDLPLAFFQRRSSGDLMARLNSHSRVREILTAGVLSGLLDGGLVAIHLVVLVLVDAPTAALVVALAVARLALFGATRHRYRELMADSLQAEADSRSYQVQVLEGVETVKATGTEPRALERWSSLYAGVLDAAVARGRLSSGVEAVLAALRVASPLAVLLFGAWRVLQGDLSLGAMLAANALAAGVLEPLSQLVSSAFQLQLLDGYLERIDDVLATSPEQKRGAGRRVEGLSGAVELDEVGLRYDPGGPWAVRDVSLAIPAGAFVAVVGRSGAGKTTLAQLMAGLLPATRGRIRFDGVDLAELDLRSLRRCIGVVPQRLDFFSGSVRSNIALADPSAPLERVEAAARTAHLDDTIRSWPMGYETLLADRGASLSGGERQRLALARALVTRPAILLLDEATSALDAETEARVQGELERLEVTRIVIAHRLSTVRRADRIVVLEAGRVVESGTHGELVERGGVYAHLVAEQRRADGEAGPDPA